VVWWRGHQDTPVPDLHVLRVFTTAEGAAGNALGVFAHVGAVEPAVRQATAARLGYSETVFVSDAARGELQIHTPAVELPFAGHPLVGSAWLLADLDVLRPPAGPVGARRDRERVWIDAEPAQAPAWDLRALPSAAAVDALAGAPDDAVHLCCWAWEDERGGEVRSRVFAPAYGVPEDPATGSASVVLCALLGRALHIRQGPPSSVSEIETRPLAGGRVELGGRVVLDERRTEVLG
jgi:predicted PhzF superfamily epimerase YddE/YHI9